MIVDVAPLLDLANHGATAMSAIHETREGNVSWTAPELRSVSPVEDELNPIKELTRDEWLMAPPIGTPLPMDITHVDRVAQDRMNLADGNTATGYACSC